MQNKISTKVIQKIANDARIIKDFDEYINSKEVYNELISMKTTQYSVIDIIKEVWDEIKGGF